jgi:hypothetical protein
MAREHGAPEVNSTQRLRRIAPFETIVLLAFATRR